MAGADWRPGNYSLGSTRDREITTKGTCKTNGPLHNKKNTGILRLARREDAIVRIVGFNLLLGVGEIYNLVSSDATYRSFWVQFVSVKNVNLVKFQSKTLALRRRHV